MKTLHSERGTSTVEFALIALPLFLMIMGGVEFGIEMFAKTRLEGALREASRMATTGDPTSIGTDGAKIDAYVRTNMQIRDGTDVRITRKSYATFAQVGSPEKKISGGASPPYCFEDVNANRLWDLDGGKAGLGGADDIVDYKVDVSYPAFFPLIVSTVTKQSRMTISARTTLRNEPFAGNTSQSVKTCCVSPAAGNPTTCS